MTEPNDAPQNQDAGGAQQPQEQGKETQSNDQLEAIQQQLDSLQKSVAERDKMIEELRASERYWAERAAASTQQPDDEDQGDEPELIEDDNPDRFVEDLSNEGVAALKKRGLLTREEAMELAAKVAEKKISEATKRLETDAKIIREFPELQDEKSPLFQKTAEIFREMVAQDDTLKRSPNAMMLAARAARAELGSATQPAPESREERIARQAGGRGVPAGSRQTEDDDGLTDTQKRILSALNADGGVQVTEEQYRARAREGVRMSTRMAIEGGAMSPKRRVGDW